MVGYYDRQPKNRWVPALVAIAFATFLAWQAGVLPFEFGRTETGELVEKSVPPDFDSLPDFPEIQPATATGNPVNTSSPPEQFEPGEAEQTAATAKAPNGNPFATLDAGEEPRRSPFDAPTDRRVDSKFADTQPAAFEESGESSPFEEAAAVATRAPTASDSSAPNVAGNFPRTETSSLPDATFDAPDEFDAAMNVETSSDVRQVSGSSHDFAKTAPAVFEPTPAAPRADPELETVLDRVDTLLEEDDYLTAHALLSRTYWSHNDWRDQLQSRIEKTARSIYAAPQPHYVKPYVVQPDEQLRTIAKQYKVPWEYLARLNQVDERRVRAGQKLKVNKGPFDAVVDLSDFTLTLHAHGYYVHRYQVGIGKEGTTPLGVFNVQQKVRNPTYYGPNGVVIDMDDPANPLGEHWIAIGDGFGIHGTIDPKSIGKARSRGCIRMRNNEVAEVFQMLSTDSKVTIRR